MSQAYLAEQVIHLIWETGNQINSTQIKLLVFGKRWKTGASVGKVQKNLLSLVTSDPFIDPGPRYVG